MDDMNMVGEQDHPMNHQSGKEDMNMVGSHIVAVTPHVSKPHDYVNHMFMRL
jgi:hypothetical protein